MVLTKLKDYKLLLAMVIVLVVFNISFGHFSFPLIPQNLYSITDDQVNNLSLDMNCQTDNLQINPACVRVPGISRDGMYLNRNPDEIFYIFKGGKYSVLTPDGGLFLGHQLSKYFYKTLGNDWAPFILQIIFLILLTILLNRNGVKWYYVVFLLTSITFLKTVSTNNLLPWSLLIYYNFKDTKQDWLKYVALSLHVAPAAALLYDALKAKNKSDLLLAGTIFFAYCAYVFNVDYASALNIITFENRSLDILLSMGVIENKIDIWNWGVLLLLVPLLNKAFLLLPLCVFLPALAPFFIFMFFLLTFQQSSKKIIIYILLALFFTERIFFINQLWTRGLNIAVDFKERKQIEKIMATERVPQVAFYNDFGVSEWFGFSSMKPLYIDELITQQKITSLRNLFKLIPYACIINYPQYNYERISPFWMEQADKDYLNDLANEEQVFFYNVSDLGYNRVKFCYGPKPNL